VPSAISLDHIVKTYPKNGGSFIALEDITLDVARGEIFVFLGPSGCGKSTLLRIICGLDQPTSGTVTFGAGHTPADVSFVFQQFALLPWLTVAENVGLGLTARHTPRATCERRVRAELERFHLDQFADARPHELSGGMKQRVGIARAFATDPKIICMDEPFSELDSFTAMELRGELLDLWKERQPTIVLVTHLIPEAITLADRIAVLSPQPGRVEAIVPVNLPRPRKPRSRAFFALEDQLTALVRP
jgi:NitT/TauT family transport system ATP-binding protein